jgi:hypothetical protein
MTRSREVVTRQAHNLKIGGANPSSATKINMNKFNQGDRVRLLIKDPKVKNTPGVVKSVAYDRVEVVLELWSRWGTFSNYFPLWFNEDQIEKI